MSENDLLPNQLRLMTEDGLRFVASYGGLRDVAIRFEERGGPNAARWQAVAKRAREALQSSDGDLYRTAIAAFSDAARLEGWSVRMS